MFEKNKYYNKYYSIIQASKNDSFQGYTEKHHIIPRSLGGDDNVDNIISLSAENHLKVHILLPFFTSGENKRKMIYAWNMMSNRNGNFTDYDEHQILREEFSKNHSKRMSGSNNPNFGVPMTEERKKVFTTKGWKHTKKSREKMLKNQPNKYGPNNPNFGNHPIQQKIKCPHCDKIGGQGNMKRYHFDNCKNKKDNNE